MRDRSYVTLFGALRTPREIVFGAGQRFLLGTLARELGSRALVCTDERMSADQSFAALVDNLRASGVRTMVYDRTIAELPLENISSSVAAAGAFGPDVVIGVGGGSCLDLAKFSALMLAHGGRVQDYYGEFKVPGPVVPILAVPTTSGTGSEVTPVAVLGDPERTVKVGVASPYLIPHTAICDPELTYMCPPRLTAIAGSDALTHAIEAFTALRRPVTSELIRQHVFIGKNALSDHQALVALSLIGKSLRRAVEDGTDRTAREQLMLGAMTAGLAFGTAGTAAAHAIQYPVGATTHTPHGVGVALLMPYVMEFNREACLPELAQIAVALGVAGSETDEAGLADRAIAGVADLFQAIGIPRTLEELGLPEDKQTWTAERALEAVRLVKNNPRPLDLAGMESIVRAAFTGERAALLHA
jgi:alcohol dehydrogenase class IV